MDLIDLLPKFYKESNEVFEMQKGIGHEINSLSLAQSDLMDQLFINTATWSLDRWDKLVGENTKGYSISDRRDIIKGKLLAQPSFTKENVIKILKTLADDGDVFEYNDIYTFEIMLKTKGMLGEKVVSILKQIEDIKPAHLDYRAIFCYIKTLLIEEDYIYYNSEQSPVCGTIDISYNQYVACDGKTIPSGVYGSILSILSEELNKVSEETIILGDGTRLTSNLELLVNKFSSDEFIKVAEELYLNNTNGKSLKDIITNEINNIYSQEFTKVSDENYVGEVE